MKFEALNNDNESPHIETREEAYRVVVDCVEKWQQSLSETVQEHPQVYVGNEAISFSIEDNPDLVSLAEAQELRIALEGLLQGAQDEGARPFSEDTIQLLIGQVSGLEMALKNRADAVSRAENHPEADRVVTLMDSIAEQLLQIRQDGDQEQKLAA